MAKIKKIYSFYDPTCRHSEQRGLYDLLITKRRIPMKTVIESIDMLKETYKCKTKAEILSFVCDVAFDKLLALITEKTGQKFKKRRNRQEDNYDNWYASASLDGSLAYNSSADDL